MHYNVTRAPQKGLKIQRKSAEATPDKDLLSLAQQKAASRRRDRTDIATGKRTATGVQRENSRWLWDDADLTKAVILNEYEAYEQL